MRIDSAGLLIKDPELPEVPPAEVLPGQHPTEDRDEVHDVYRSWRRIADSYEGTRVLVGEVWVPDAQRFAAYLGPTRCTPRSTSTSCRARGMPRSSAPRST